MAINRRLHANDPQPVSCHHGHLTVPLTLRLVAAAGKGTGRHCAAAWLLAHSHGPGDPLRDVFSLC